MFKLFSLLHYLSLKLGLVDLSANFLVILVKRISKNNRRKVLVLGKPVFNEDVKGLISEGNKLDYLLLPKFFLDRYVEKYVSFHKKLNDANYWPLMANSPERAKLRKKMERVFKILLDKLNFDCILAGNFVYKSHQELFIAAKAINIPIFVIYKEGMIPPDRFHLSKERLYGTKKSFASMIFVYNEYIASMLSDAKIPGIKKNNLEIVGIPRFDLILKSEKKVSKRQSLKKIALFFFSEKNKSKYLVDSSENLEEYEKRLYEFQKWFFDYASLNKDIELIIKTKTSASELNQISKYLKNLGYKNSFNNIKVESKKTSIEVIEESDIIAGYSSTTLLEALLYGKPIIEPDLTDLEKIGSFNYFDNNANISNRIISKNSLFELLDSFKNQIKFPDNDLVKKSLKPLIYQVDGNSSRRVESKIIQFLEGSKNE